MPPSKASPNRDTLGTLGLAFAVGIAAFLLVLGTGTGLGSGLLKAFPLTMMVGLLLLAAGLSAARREINSGWPATVFLSSVSAAIFALILSSKWQTGLTTDILMGGLLPLSDARGYLHGALVFLNEGSLTEWTTRRPLATLQLAGLLGMGGGSLRMALAILTAFSAGAAVALFAVLGRTLGMAAALSSGAAVIPFLFPAIGTTMSETLGFTLGTSGFVLMWISVHHQDADKRTVALFATGLGLMALGLAARAGAMFVLPLLVLYAGWRFRGPRRFCIYSAGAALTAVILAFALNAAVVALYGAPGAQAFSNFSFTLYGLVTGGHDWTQIFRDVPELSALSANGQAREAYRLALDHLGAHPMDLLRGVLHHYNDFFINTRWFQFDGIGSSRVALALIALAGLVHLFRHRQGNGESFILAGTFGVWLSVPFIADGGTRIHAASVAFTAALVAIGIRTIAAWAGREPRARPNNPAITYGAGLIAGLTLISLALAPVFQGKAVAISNPACAGGEISGAFATAPGAHLDLVTGKNVQISDALTLELSQRSHPRKVPLLDTPLALTPPLRIGYAVPLGDPTTEAGWIVTEQGRDLPPRFTACGRRQSGLLFLKNMKPLP